MVGYERRQQILEIMRRNNQFVSVEQLCNELFSSGATIRRDLHDLEANRLIRRTRGGAILVEGSTSEDPIAFRENQNSMKKQIIAELASRHIHDGMTLFLDSSSTVGALARMLDRFSNLKVVTNGLKTALLLSNFPNVKVLCTGGSLRENSKSLVGEAACDFVSRFNADVAFLSCRGMSIERGVSEASEEEYCVKHRYLANCKKAVLLCDTSKMDLVYSCKLAAISDFAEIITEKKEISDRCNLHVKH